MFREQASAENANQKTPKGADMVAKIAAGKLKKRLTELSLLGQSHVAEPDSPVVEKFLKTLGGKLGGATVTVDHFSKWQVGSDKPTTSA
jgi:translation elongation factor EF-Ts